MPDKPVELETPRWRVWWAKVRGWWKVAAPLLTVAVMLAAVWSAQQSGSDSASSASEATKTAASADRIARSNRDFLRQLEVTRATAIRDSCEGNIQQDNVVRAILRTSIQRTRATRGDAVADDFERLSTRLMRPLGGLKPLSKATIAARCQARVDAGTVQPEG